MDYRKTMYETPVASIIASALSIKFFLVGSHGPENKSCVEFHGLVSRRPRKTQIRTKQACDIATLKTRIEVAPQYTETAPIW